ncbi:carboxypeptidase regulatory-like domain-containing protein [Euzebyella saccharophila]|uniref:Carboxypeptidase regulatory-like domain-containing protein n=1 Tax=Euzebyella saccharophila TaxID=679664 RepID=A0ABV8JVA1_9FLAO|nr:carboxypeptidase regulatory-like domain-containing protein [Euzebyella saccharophila]
MNNTYNSRLILIMVFIIALTACEEETIGDTVFGKLEGRVVVNNQNIPLENVKITTNPSSTTVFTDAQGNFVIDEISTGDYSVQADKDDFQTSFEPASILGEKTTNIVFELDSVEAANLSPLRPELLFPMDEAKNVVSPVEFVWSSSKNDTDDILYELELRNGTTGEVQRYENLKDTVLIVEELTVGANFFWQIKATDGISEDVQSNLGSFQLKGVEDNRFLFVRNVNGNNVIVSGGEPAGANNSEINQNEVQLTSSSINSYRPKANFTVNKIAFLATQDGDAQLFMMDLNGGNKIQLTKNVPVAGFKQSELEFTWSQNSNILYYPNFNKLYSVQIDGSGTTLIYEAPAGEFISEVASNPTNNLLAIKTNDTNGYNVKIQLINPANGTLVSTIVEGTMGAFGGLDYSIDGTKILYTQDASGAENSQYRQLDSRIFEYDTVSDSTVEIDTDKPTGFNNLDAKYAPNEGAIIYTYTSNDGISEKQIYRKVLDAVEDDDQELIFTNASMPNWE